TGRIAYRSANLCRPAYLISEQRDDSNGDFFGSPHRGRSFRRRDARSAVLAPAKRKSHSKASHLPAVDVPHGSDVFTPEALRCGCGGPPWQKSKPAETRRSGAVANSG